tara:strand:- start:181 stop:459 length:279 start_codon:yes stop_codon:yes gene_type:complete
MKLLYRKNETDDTKLINQVKPEILRFLKSSIKPKYSASYRSIIASFKSKSHYRDLTIDEVDCIQLYLDDRFQPATKNDFLFGDYLLKTQDKY